MSEQSPERIFRELEDDIVSHRSRSSRAQVFQEVAKGYEREGDEDAAKNARIEAAAFELHTRQKNKSFPGYFQPMIAYSDGQTVPPRDFFNEERLNYLTERAQSTPNPIHAARFADVVWDFATSKKPEMARLAMRKYLDCADLYHANGWGTNFGDAIKRAAELATSYVIRPCSPLSRKACLAT